MQIRRKICLSVHKRVQQRRNFTQVLKQTTKSLSKSERLLLIQINKPRRFTLKTPIVLMVFCILMNRSTGQKNTLLDFSHRCHILLTERELRQKRLRFCMFLFSQFEFAYFIIIHNKVHSVASCKKRP